jgi:Rrf2 family protein
LLITQKHRYALRAVYELARRNPDVPVKLSEIAEVQAIPHRFLETIMGRLRHRGLVAAKRGSAGGYRLGRPADQVSVGDVFRTLEEPGARKRCTACTGRDDCPLAEDCVFIPLWDRLEHAVTSVYDSITIEDLVRDDRAGVGRPAVEAST